MDIHQQCSSNRMCASESGGGLITVSLPGPTSDNMPATGSQVTQILPRTIDYKGPKLPNNLSPAKHVVTRSWGCVAKGVGHRSGLLVKEQGQGHHPLDS